MGRGIRGIAGAPMAENAEKVEAFSFLGGEVWVGVVFGEEEEEEEGGERAS